jgi:heme-degrading monooxygenase HmoA
MTLEIVQWTAKEGHEAAQGYIAHRFFRCIEDTRKYVLLVEWSHLEAHTEQFRGSELYQQYRSLLKPYYEENSTLNHYDQIE